MEAKIATAEYRMTQWAAIIKECRESGLQVKTWCRQNDVKEAMYYYWLRKLRTVASEAIKENGNPICFAPLKIEKPINNQRFLPDAIIHIGNATLELSNEISPNLISLLIKEIAHVK